MPQPIPGNITPAGRRLLDYLEETGRTQSWVYRNLRTSKGAPYTRSYFYYVLTGSRATPADFWDQVSALVNEPKERFTAEQVATPA